MEGALNSGARLAHKLAARFSLAAR
jgi:hypothetical protein